MSDSGVMHSSVLPHHANSMTLSSLVPSVSFRSPLLHLQLRHVRSRGSIHSTDTCRVRLRQRPKAAAGSLQVQQQLRRRRGLSMTIR